MMTESDEVVSEVDVYLSKTLAKNLFLFQYPVRPSTKTYDDAKCLQARVKTKNQKVELQLGLNVCCSNYDQSKGEQIALNADGDRASDTTCFDSSYMDKQVLTSTNAVTSNFRYAVGLLRPGELHLTPLQALLQLRPSFSYLDKADAHLLKSDNKGASETVEDGMAEEEEARAVHVKFAGIETERGKLARERSFKYLEQQLASEPYQLAAYYPVGSRMSSMEGAYLHCAKMDHDASDLPGTVSDYLHSLLPESLRIATGLRESGSQSCVAKLQNMPLAEQIKTILISAKVVKFSQLMDLLSSNTDASQVLRFLQPIAMLVQGCWVVKSEILYPKDSTATSVGVETLCRARDYIMWQFTQKQVLLRSEIVKTLKLSMDEVTDLLRQFAKHVPSVGWQFTYDSDEEFLSRYPEVVQRHQMLWDAKSSQLVRVLQHNSIKDSTSPCPPRPVQRQKSRRKSQNQSDSAEESGIDDSAALKKSPHIGKGDSPTKKLTKYRPRSHIATLDVSPTRLEFLPSPELKRELAQFSIDELKSRHCLTMTEAKRLLMLKLAESPPGHILGRGVSDKLIEETMLDLGAQQLQNKWPQNTTPEPLFAFLKLGDHDKFREALIDLFTKMARIRISTFKKKVEDELGESMAEPVCRKILQDYCITKSGYYYLKGTISSDS